MRIQLKLGVITAKEIAESMQGTLVSASADAENYEIALLTDTVGEIAQKTLYIASEDSSLNEMMAASKNGAYCVLCTKAPASLEKIPDTAVIVCDNANIAIERFAKKYAKRGCHKTIAITGSKGKTRTGEFVYSVLEEKYKIFAATDKKSKEKDDALVLLGIPEGTDFLLAELKIRDKGDIARLAGVFDCDVGIVTELNSSFGSDANVNVLAGLKEGGEVAFCFEDGVPSMLCRSDIDADSVSVHNAEASLHAENICVNEETTVFDIVGDGVCIKNVEIPFTGDDNIKSALFAALVGIKYGIDSEKIRRGIKNFHSPELGVGISTIGGITFIVDTSSANVDSVRSGIDTLCDIASRHKGARKIALVGDIRDFGQDTRTLHEKMGSYIYEKKIDKLFTFGIAAEQMCVGARRSGMREEDVFGNLDLFSPLKTAETIADVLKDGDVLLIRMGRQNAAEEIIRYLRNKFEK